MRSPTGTAHVPIPRIVLAAASSGSGKTTIALGLVTALRRRGLRVRAAKVGPDFIDAAHLARASDAPARNLDAWIASPDLVRASFARGTRDADVAVVEGVMGLFDGRHGSGEGSTAHVARLLEAPVVLVLDCARASTTIGAVAYGLARYDPHVRVAGVILNRVASERHAVTVTDACVRAGVAVLGAIGKDERLSIESRHLGLVEPEGDRWAAACAAAADALERAIDLDALLALANGAPPLPYDEPVLRENVDVRIAVARDEAFWFYDEASLDALRDAGAQLVPYSPLRDRFPDVHAAFVGGGYPELHGAALAANGAARDGLRRAVADGMPVYAECGGLMYLGEVIESDGAEHAMVGAIAARSQIAQRRSALRYVEAQALGDGPLLHANQVVRGHEFHYSQTQYGERAPVYTIDGEAEGFTRGNLHASYVHVHLGALAGAAQRFTDAARCFGGVR